MNWTAIDGLSLAIAIIEEIMCEAKARGEAESASALREAHDTLKYIKGDM
jgi:hypothetical protein